MSVELVQSVTRTLDILEALAFAEEELSLNRLQAQLSLPPSTLHRLLGTLIERGYVEQNSDNHHYGPGLKILEIAEAAKRNTRFELGHVVRPFLERLTDDIGETSNFVIRKDDSVVYVEQVSSQHSVRMFTEVGHRAPLYCTGAGKAIISCLPADAVEAYLSTVALEQLTPHTLASIEALTRDVSCIRERGFAVDNEEFELGVRCVAAPILDASGRCAGAMSVSGPTTRMSLERAQSLGPHVRDVSNLCSARLGYRSGTSDAHSGL